MKSGFITGFLCAFVLVLILAVHTDAYNIELATEREAQGRSYTDCTCKPSIKERGLIASMCAAPSINGPWSHECLYESEKK